MDMPIAKTEEFLAKVEVKNRIQIPVLVRWKNRLDPVEVLHVHVRHEFSSQSFYARYRKDHRITIPKLVAEELELKPGSVVEVTLYGEE